LEHQANAHHQTQFVDSRNVLLVVSVDHTDIS